MAAKKGLFRLLERISRVFAVIVKHLRVLTGQISDLCNAVARFLEIFEEMWRNCKKRCNFSHLARSFKIFKDLARSCKRSMIWSVWSCFWGAFVEKILKDVRWKLSCRTNLPCSANIEVFKDLSTDRTGRPTDIKRIDVWISHRADVDGINPELNLNFGLSYWQTSSGLSLADINGQNLECPSPGVLRLSHGRILTGASYITKTASECCTPFVCSSLLTLSSGFYRCEEFVLRHTWIF